MRSLSKAQVRQRQKVSVLSVLGVGAAIGLAVMVLMGYIQLTIISDEVVSLQNQLEELQTENVTLTAQHEQMFDLATVKEVAEAAGMSKPSSSQDLLHRSVGGRQCRGLSAGGVQSAQPFADLAEPRDLRRGGIFRVTAAL